MFTDTMKINGIVHHIVSKKPITYQMKRLYRKYVRERQKGNEAEKLKKQLALC
jgi:hypothetical protein